MLVQVLIVSFIVSLCAVLFSLGLCDIAYSELYREQNQERSDCTQESGTGPWKQAGSLSCVQSLRSWFCSPSQPAIPAWF